LCPICMADLGDVIQLQVHFDEEHSKEDPAVVKNLKAVFGKIKKVADEVGIPRLPSSESASDLASSILSPTQSGLNKRPSPNRESSLGPTSKTTVNVYGTEYEASYHPVSGISNQDLEDNQANNYLPSVNLMSTFRQERSRRADMLAMDTNKLIIRLEKLMTSLPVHDPVKRRAHEQAVVPWVPEDVVKLCPNCAKSFNLTRRKHHCRLCGSIMCNDCSEYIDFDMANKLISQSGLKGENDPNDAVQIRKAAVEDLVSKVADLAGLSESQCRFRTCLYCLETLLKRDARIRIKTDQPAIVFYYGKLRELMTEGAKMSKEYQAMAAELNAGEGAQTKHKIDSAKVLRLKLLKMAETVDAVSKRIAGLELADEDQLDPLAMGSYATLKSRIRIASVNFVKETLVGLPGIPTEEELSRLQQSRQKEASLRVEEEKKQSVLAKMKFDRMPQTQQQRATSGDKRRKQTVSFDTGFVSSLSGNNYVSSDDPIVQQMCNLREFIGQARAAGRADDARLLEENLRDLQEEYQRQRAQLEENYESYRHIFESSGGRAKTNDDTVDSVNPDDDLEDGDMDMTNPFADATEDEIASIESTLESLDREHQMVADPGEKNNVSTEEELERQTIQLGSADFDEYDASGKNPFF